MAAIRCANTSESVSDRKITPLACKLRTQLSGILDDAVVNDGETFVSVGVGMRVSIAWFAVRSPAGVRDARRALQSLRQRAFEIAHLSFALEDR